jgi:hypothetical protein
MEPNTLQLIGIAIQTIILLAGGFIALGATKNEIRHQGEILVNLDKRIDKLEVAFILLARTDERLNALDQRMLLQGRRIDRVQYATRQTEEETSS